ncbi:hypothetical protein D3C80_2229430 [compost metagenome]
MDGRVIAHARQGCVKATEVEAIWSIGEVEILFERLTFGGGLTLFAEPVLEQVLVGKLQKRRTVAG